jgi:2-keto-3-deoxy-L-rhamnonate aldolase RhmA
VSARLERNETFRRRVLAGEPVYGTFLSMGSAVSAEVCARAGFDWCLVDLEHGLGAEAALTSELMALELGGVAALVRVETAFPLRISRALDQGAAGLMVPQVRSADEAAFAVRCVRYPPAGARGVALSVRGADFSGVTADQLGRLNEGLVTLIQIENREALAELDAIAAVDGVDVLFVGPNDLTHSLAIPGLFEDPSYLDALATVARTAAAAGKASGIMLRSPAEVPALRELGYSFFAMSTDAGLLAGAARGALAAMRDGR